MKYAQFLMVVIIYIFLTITVLTSCYLANLICLIKKRMCLPLLMVIFLAGASTSDLSVILDIVEMNGALSKYTRYSQRAEAPELTCMDTQRGHCCAGGSQCAAEDALEIRTCFISFTISGLLKGQK